MSRDSFGSRVGFIIAAAGSSIGLGNLWRFPYLIEKYGGGMFILIYVIATLTFGLMLMILEVSVGRKTGKTVVEAYGELAHKYKWLGWVTILVPIVLLAFYCPVGGWVLKYLYAFLTGDIFSFADIGSSTAYFEEFVANSGGFLDGPIVWFVIFLSVSVLILLKGVKKGIEFVSKICMPLFLIILIGLIIYTFTIPGMIPGLEKFFVPNFEDFSGESVAAAVGQVFFSLSLGQGVMLTYGSYMNKKDDIRKTLRTTVAIDCIVAILCGLLIVPIVYVMAGDYAVSGSGLMFKMLPYLFFNMPMGRAIGVLFFAMVFFAAWTSAMAVAEVMVSMLHDSRGISRRNSVFITLAVLLVLGLVCCLSNGVLSGVTIGGMIISEFFDYITTALLIPLTAMIMCILIGYVVGTKVVCEEVGIAEGTGTAKAYSVMIKFVCPLLLIVVMVSGFIGI